MNFLPGTVKVWDEGIENNLQRKLMNAPCSQPKDVNWIEVRPNFHRRNLSFCLGLHNCRPFCCTFFQYNLQRVSPSNALPCFLLIIFILYIRRRYNRRNLLYRQYRNLLYNLYDWLNIDDRKNNLNKKQSKNIKKTYFVFLIRYGSIQFFFNFLREPIKSLLNFCRSLFSLSSSF